MNRNILSPNHAPERIADERFAKALGELADHIARVEAELAIVKATLAGLSAEDAPLICCGTDCPENCGDMACLDARHYDALERLNDDLMRDADVFGIGPAGSAADMAEAFRYPPPPHVGVRRAARMLADVDRHTLSYADHARVCTSFDGGAA